LAVLGPPRLCPTTVERCTRRMAIFQPRIHERNERIRRPDLRISSIKKYGGQRRVWGCRRKDNEGTPQYRGIGRSGIKCGKQRKGRFRESSLERRSGSSWNLTSVPTSRRGHGNPKISKIFSDKMSVDRNNFNWSTHADCLMSKS
jgi:hypothetical protein